MCTEVAVENVLFAAFVLVAAGAILWMHGWDQRRPSAVAQTGTALLCAGGLLIGTVALAIFVGMLVSNVAQVVQANTVSPQYEQTPVR